MTLVVVAVGSNENRDDNIAAALTAMKNAFGELTVSPVYESAGEFKHNILNEESDVSLLDYYNLVACFNTSFSILEIKNKLIAIETQLGRIRNTDIVSIDLDLLLFGNYVGKEDKNIIPHPDILECDYVLRPLSDLLPNANHPIIARTYSELWLEVTKQSELVPVDFVWDSQLVSSVVTINPL
jgi:2-amino-4-hydroxy-6-hydroxymethyldihydropteridine diphosphokinase